jgi:poly-gamma-glutamate synthesis protein (capsule biosynthesis protein)
MRLALVGDVMLGRMVNDYLRTRDTESVWGDTLPILGQADFRMCNLECAISDRGEPWEITPKEFHFRSDRKNARVLQMAGISAVSLANNHVLDFGYDALTDTLRTLDAFGIYHAGAGANRSEACEPKIISLKGRRIGIIAATDNQPEWEATETKPGVFYVPIDPSDSRAKKLVRLVRQTRKVVDMLIVSLHWGSNWGYEPPIEHQEFARLLGDVGADVIFGHSAHVFRGVQIYAGRPILYSTGNFIDDYAIDRVERNDESFVFVLETEDSNFSRLKLFPTVIENCSARRAIGSEKDAIEQKMQFLCESMKSRSVMKKDGTGEFLEIMV